MRVAHERVLMMGHVCNGAVVRIRARRGCERVSGVARQQEMLREVQDAEMSPVAGVEFLSMQNDQVVG